MLLLVLIGVQALEPPAATADAGEFYREAIEHWDSNVHVALVTVVDATTGLETDVCVDVGDLGAAFALEHGLERCPDTPNRSSLDSALDRIVVSHFAAKRLCASRAKQRNRIGTRRRAT